MAAELKLTEREKKLIASAREPATQEAKSIPPWLTVIAIVSAPFMFALFFARMDVIVNVFESAGIEQLVSRLKAYKPLITQYQWHVYTIILILYVLRQEAMIRSRDKLIARMNWHIERVEKNVRSESSV